jgi:DnaJ family protein C protein 7
MSANKYEEALEDSKAADELEPQNPKVLNRLARIYTSIGRPSEALETLDRISKFSTVSPQDRSPALSMQTHLKQAEDVLREGSTGSMAIHALDQAERGLGPSVQRPRKWWLMRGEAFLKMGNVNALGDAQNVAMTLLRKNGQDPEALVMRGRALYAQGDNDKAIQHFRQALSCDPDFKDAVKYLRMVQKLDRMKDEGNVAFKGGRHKQAVEIYTKALEVDPNNKGTNSKLLQNRAMASIKVSLCFSLYYLDLAIPNTILSSKTTNMPSTTAPAPSNSTPLTSKPAKPKPAPSANPATGRPHVVNLKPSKNPTPKSLALLKTSATQRWN